jgi:hypothetical protein
MIAPETEVVQQWDRPGARGTFEVVHPPGRADVLPE